MSKIYTYRVIKYFPFPRSDEFFNVGIIVQDEKGESKSLYIDEYEQHIKNLCQFPSIDKRALPAFLKNIRKEQSPQSWYDNYLRFSEVDVIICKQGIDEVANMLYEDYIGYKFHIKDLKDRYQAARENTKTIFEKKFQNKLIIDWEEQSFYVTNKRTNKRHFAQFGSINDKQAIQKLMFFSFESKRYKEININFLGINKADDERIKSCKEDFFELSHIKYYSYCNEEESEKYLEEVSA